ncbi:MAG: sulfatase-like hydrolase/transferase [Anaerolineaceae bacterium]|nr:sulfatase-like hydrolase/transferase [Anaerolineaceae bacterium]
MAERPNILVFYTDDHAQWASGCYGNQEIKTPNLDHLAETGVLMQNAFTPTPVCSPSRACFHTGRLASQHGVHDYLASGLPDVAEVDWMGDEISIAQILKKVGYQTALSGKWHLGEGHGVPAGYDSWFSLGTDYPMNHGQPRRYNVNGVLEERTGHLTRNITDEAIRYLRNIDEEKPFFLFVGHYATHSPWEGHPERLVEQYRECSFDDIPEDSMYPFGRMNLESTDPTRSDPQEALAQYYAAVSQIDEGIGHVLDELEALDLREDTLIVYTSDHGLNCSQHGVWGKGNGTLPLNMLEESIRIPMIFNHTGKLYDHQIRDEYVDHMDLFRTLLTYAGVRLPEALEKEKKFPGKSFTPLLTNRNLSEPWRDVQFGEYGNMRMIRSKQYKLLRWYPDGAEENLLFDLHNDPRETTNLFLDPEYEVLIKDLTRRMELYFYHYQDAVKSGLNVLDLPRHNTTEAWRNP